MMVKCFLKRNQVVGQNLVGSLKGDSMGDIFNLCIGPVLEAIVMAGKKAPKIGNFVISCAAAWGRGMGSLPSGIGAGCSTVREAYVMAAAFLYSFG